VGVLRHVFKRPAEIGSLELGAELLAFNSLCASSESIQQFPYCYVIPEAELENGQKRISQILCLYHSFDADDTPELLPQGKYVMLRKNIRFRDEENRSEAYDMVAAFFEPISFRCAGNAMRYRRTRPIFCATAGIFISSSWRPSRTRGAERPQARRAALDRLL
jgi:hypothetical protein